MATPHFMMNMGCLSNTVVIEKLAFAQNVCKFNIHL